MVLSFVRGKSVGSQNSLLRPQKTFKSLLGEIFMLETHISFAIEGLLKSKKLFRLAYLMLVEIEFNFLFGVTPRSLWPTSGLELQAKSSVPNNKTFGLDPII